VDHRMREEYGVELHKQMMSVHAARWLPGDRKDIEEVLAKRYSTRITSDLDGHPIVLFDSAYALQQAEEKVGKANLFTYKSD